MMKEIRKIMWLLVAVALPLVLMSCGDDKDDDKPDEPAKYSEVVATYSVDLSGDYYDLWDIQVTYTNANGGQEVVSIDKDWDMAFRFTPRMNVPEKFVFNVVGVPKNPAVKVDPDKIYELSKNLQFIVMGVKDGNVSILGGQGSSQSASIHAKGDKLTRQLTEGITIASGTYDVDVDWD